MHGGLADTLIIGLPMVLALFAAMMRVDELLFAPERHDQDGEHPRHRFAVADEHGEQVLTDPDGRSYTTTPHNPISRKRAA